MAAPTPQSMPSPAAIMDLSTAYWGAQTLLTANRIGVFAALGDAPLDAATLASKLGTHERTTRLLLNACVAMDLLTRDGDRYANSAQSRAFLVPGGPGFLGNAIRYADNLYATWGELETALRENRPPMATETYTGDDAEITRDFVYAMHDRAMGIGRVLVEIVDLTDRSSLLDVGGGPGTYASLLAQKFPQLQCMTIDLPGVVAHAREIIAGFGVGDRVKPVACDYLTSDFPGRHDAVMISGVFHRETEAGCRRLIDKAVAVLEPRGMLIVSDVFTEAGGVGPPFAALFGLNMMLTAPDGGVHADADVAAWMGDAGFDVSITPFPPPMPHRIVAGRLRD